MTSALGWQVHVGSNPNTRSLGNWPIQTNGSEILRVAAILLTEAGIKVCAPVHDAVLIEAPLNRIEQDVKKAQKLMQEAGEIVLNGFKLRTDAEIVRYPDRYVDDRGQKMWDTVIEILRKIEKN